MISANRYIINFEEMTEEDARAGWPDLMRIVEERVKPERLASLKTWSSDKAKRAERWWQFSRSAKDLHAAIRGLGRVLALSRVGQQCAIAFLPPGMVYADSVVVFAFATSGAFAALQSRPHETWARFFSSSMKDDLRYTPTDCFETFPFPDDFENNPQVEACGQAYYEFRAALMVRNNEGLTKTYNRFHDPNETSLDIARLRELHAVMDRAVLDAYGWTDIPTDCQFLLDYEDDEDEDDEAFSLSAAATGRKARTRKKPWRYRWPDEIRDEVLARLLALNAKRAEEERLAGAAAAGVKDKRATPKRGRELPAAVGPDLFSTTSAARPAERREVATVPVLQATELMVAILDQFRPARVQQFVAERAFILAVNQNAREQFANEQTAKRASTAKSGAQFKTVWQSIVAMGYATISGTGIVSRTKKGVTLTQLEHARMAEEAVKLFKAGEAAKRAWPVEVDNVQYVVP